VGADLDATDGSPATDWQPGRAHGAGVERRTELDDGAMVTGGDATTDVMHFRRDVGELRACRDRLLATSERPMLEEFDSHRLGERGRNRRRQKK
jgi:hypothetical protein